MSWTTSCPSPRLISLTSTKPSSRPDHLNHPLSYIHSSTLPPSSALPGRKPALRCSAPAASPTKMTKRNGKRSWKADQSPPDLSTETKCHPCQRPQLHPDPRQNLLPRRLRSSRGTLNWCRNPSLPKAKMPNYQLSRGRFSWPATSSSPVYQQPFPK